MPKIILDLRQKLIDETRKQINENGYSATTVRSVASALGVGVGTVYNYFPSKEMLTASFMLEDWQKTIGKMESGTNEIKDPADICEVIHLELRAFIDEHASLFKDGEAVKAFAGAISARHHILREQIANVISERIKLCDAIDKAFTTEFIAEAILTWTVAGKSFSDIKPIIEKIF